LEEGFVDALGDLFGKGLLGSNSTLIYFIVGYGVLGGY
jgi:hypothetical protein